MRQDALVEHREDLASYRRGDMTDLAFGIFASVFIILAISWIVWWRRRQADLVVRRVGQAGDIIDAEVVETSAPSTALAPVHMVDPQGRKVCGFCGGYSPTWYRPRTLVMDEGAMGTVRARLRIPPAWRVRDLEDAPQDVCARCRLLETQGLAAEVEERHRMHEETTVAVMRRHAEFIETFHEKMRQRSGRARSWGGRADTF